MKKSRHSSFLIHYSNSSGQSLVEILVALAIGTILIIAATTVIAPALRTNTQADKVQVSSALGKELLENVRVFSEGDWHNISSLATSSVNKYFLVSARSPFVAATGTEGISSDGVSSGTIGYWKLDESTGTVAYDFSGSGNNGTLTGGPTQATGQVSNGLQFNGINQYVISTSSLGISGNATFTMCAWIKWTGGSWSSDWPSFMGNNSTGVASQGLSFTVSQGRPAIDFWNNRWRASTALSVNTWYNICGTKSAGVISTTSKLYVNGALVPGAVEGADTTPNITDSPAVIGRLDATRWFQGVIDEVRFYNRVLSADEIKNIYQANIYTRYFYLENAGRDASGNILSGGGTNDPSTEKLNVVYGWPNGPTSTFSTYLTRFRNNVFYQTDWSGGPGQEGPVTSTNSRFSTSTQIFYATTTGSIIINFQP